MMALSPNQRLELIKRVNSLTQPDFERLIFALRVPSNIVPSQAVPLGERSSALLHWVESSIGCGMEAFIDVLDNILPSSLPYINPGVQEISEATPDEIQKIASAQIKILDSYHREVLTQAKGSFRWALITTIAGFLFFVCAVGFTLTKTGKSKALIPLISGAVIEVIAGVNFYLYGQATQQLSSFHRKLDRTQRFLLANSMCEAIKGEEREKTRSELVRTVSQFINEKD